MILTKNKASRFLHFKTHNYLGSHEHPQIYHNLQFDSNRYSFGLNMDKAFGLIVI